MQTTRDERPEHRENHTRSTSGREGHSNSHERNEQFERSTR